MSEDQVTPIKSPGKHENSHNSFHLPSPLPTKRNRTFSQSQRASAGPTYKGVVKNFCRQKGHGFIHPSTGGEAIFVHISDIETDCALKEGDEVTYKLCPVPPKMEKFSAVHVKLIHPVEGVEHEKWDNTHTHPEGN